jgi:type II secretory pathway predicted ATPase ExeA
LEAPEFRQLKQRIALRCVLRGLTPVETVDYVNSRLARAGLKHQAILPVELLEEMAHRTQGIPRLINAVCDNLLLTAFAMESKTATFEMLDEVTSDMRLEYPRKPTLAESPYDPIKRSAEYRF